MSGRQRFWVGFWLWWLVAIPVLIALSPHDVSKPVDPSTISDSACGSFRHVTSATLVNDTGPAKLYSVQCTQPTNPGQPPATITLTVGQ
jgi:hypothetical protein